MFRRIVRYAERRFSLGARLDGIRDPRQRRRIRWPVVLRSMMQIVLNRLGSINAIECARRGKMIEPVHGFLPLVVDGHEVCASYKRCCPACLKRTVNGKTH